MGVEGDAEEEPAALVLVEDVEFADWFDIVWTRGISTITIDAAVGVSVSSSTPSAIGNDIVDSIISKIRRIDTCIP